MRLDRVTPENIAEIGNNERFVFGSNLNRGPKNVSGAALTARQWGSKDTHVSGPQGRTYAIPTKDEHLATRPLPDIAKDVHWFIEYAKIRRDLTFYVTKIGCGLAGLTPAQVAPMFAEAKDVKNVWLPQEFWEVLK